MTHETTIKRIPKKYKWVKTTCNCANESDQECYRIHHEKRLILSFIGGLLTNK